MQKPPKPPDLKPISDAQLELGRQAADLAREQMGLSREQFEFFQTQSMEELAFAREQADRMLGFQERAFEADEPMREMSGRVGAAQLALMEQAREFSDRDRTRYEETFIPLQDRFISDAEAYDSEARREMEAGRAMEDVQRNMEAQRANADARLSGMGLDPSQFRSASIANTLGAQAAAAGAMGANNARNMVEDKGRALRADAINLGMGLPAQAAQGMGMSSAAGGAAMGAAGAGAAGTLGAIGTAAGLSQGAAGLRGSALGNMGALTGTPMQWAGMGNNSMGTAGNMYNNAGSTMTQGFQNQMASFNARQQQIGQLAGMATSAAGMFFSGGGEVRRPAYFTGGGQPEYDPPEFEPIERTRPELPKLELEVDDIRPTALPKPKRPKRDVKGLIAEGLGAIGSNLSDWEDVEVQRTLRPIVMNSGGVVPPHLRRGQNLPRMGGGQNLPRVGGGQNLPPRHPTGIPAPQPGGMSLPRMGGGMAPPQMTGFPQINRAGLRGFNPRRPMPSGPMGRIGGQPRPPVPYLSGGGAIPNQQSRDVVPAMLHEGEYVIPADVVRSVGLEKLDKLVAKYHNPEA